MRLEPEDIVQIVEYSAALHERASPSFRPVQWKTEEQSEVVSARWNRWLQVAGEGDEARLLRGRNSWEGWDPSKIKELLGDVQWQGEALPSWASVLAEVFSEGPSSFEISSSNPRYLKEEHPFAFEELNVPFVEYARSRVLDCVGAADDVLATQAMARLERSLLDRLTSLSWRTLEFEFSMHRLRRRRRTNAILRSPNSKEGRLRRILATNMHAGFRNDFLTYPVLPRWLATATELGGDNR